MRSFTVLGGLLALWLALVAAKPPSDDEVSALREQREAAATVFYQDVDEATAASAVLQAIRTIDPNHIQAEAVEGRVLGLRTWNTYAVFAFPNGIDYYEVLLGGQDTGTEVSVRFHRDSHSGILGAKENQPQGYREGLRIYGTQGATLDDYMLFHERVAYFLGQGPWPACKRRPKVERKGPSFVCRAPGAPGNPKPPESRTAAQSE